MKKFLLIASAAIVASVGVTYAANSMLKVSENSKCDHGLKCFNCGGTGWTKGSNTKCFVCKGTGANISY
jgi:hypothetical protein